MINSLYAYHHQTTTKFDKNEEKQETKSYKMEAISKVGISSFITNFNTVKFKCTKLEYHKSTGKIQ